MEESMWEAALLVGDPRVGWADTASILVLLALNVALQGAWEPRGNLQGCGYSSTRVEETALSAPLNSERDRSRCGRKT